jgi:hypothetical protein
MMSWILRFIVRELKVYRYNLGRLILISVIQWNYTAIDIGIEINFFMRCFQLWITKRILVIWRLLYIKEHLSDRRSVNIHLSKFFFHWYWTRVNEEPRIQGFCMIHASFEMPFLRKKYKIKYSGNFRLNFSIYRVNVTINIS